MNVDVYVTRRIALSGGRIAAVGAIVSVPAIEAHELLRARFATPVHPVRARAVIRSALLDAIQAKRAALRAERTTRITVTELRDGIPAAALITSGSRKRIRKITRWSEDGMPLEAVETDV